MEFNPGSVQQLQQLLFAPCYRKISKEKVIKTNWKSTNPSDNNTNHNENNNKDELTLIIPEERIFRTENIFVIKIKI
jgi:hypothetical protein